ASQTRRSDAFSLNISCLSRRHRRPALDVIPMPSKMRPPSLTRSSVFDVPVSRSDQDPFGGLHRHHHHGPAQKGPAKRLDAGLASAAAGTEAAGRAGLYAAFRAGAGGSGDA